MEFIVKSQNQQNRMIKLFITDLDGCLTEPFQAPDWKLLSEIRSLNQQSKEIEHIPPLSICSGRPLPYVEAVAQWLDVKVPVVFESAGMYLLSSNSPVFDAVFDEEAEREVEDLKKWLKGKIIPEYEGMELEFTKKMDAGLIHLERPVIEDAFSRVREYVEEHYPLFEVHMTDVSINIILKENNKKKGIRMMCERLDLDPSEVAYIGDSSGDIPGLKLVGHPFAPSNAAESVKKVAEVIDLQSTEAVLEVYNRIIEYNENKALAE